MIDLDELEAKAKAATPGPWAYDGHNGIAATASDQLNGGYFVSEVMGPDKARNASLIAAADPETVIDLIRELREARAAVAAEREACAALCDAAELRYWEREPRRIPGLRADPETSAGACAAKIRARGAKGGE